MRKDLVIIAPVVTEKTVAQIGKYTFLVHVDATKEDITEAVKEFYGADVQKINIIRTPQKTRVIGKGRTMTKRPEQKKAVITLGTNKTIDFNAFK